MGKEFVFSRDRCVLKFAAREHVEWLAQSPDKLPIKQMNGRVLYALPTTKSAAFTTANSDDLALDIARNAGSSQESTGIPSSDLYTHVKFVVYMLGVRSCS